MRLRPPTVEPAATKARLYLPSYELIGAFPHSDQDDRHFEKGRETNITGVFRVDGWMDGQTDKQPELFGLVASGPASVGRLRRLGAGENKVEHFHGDKVTVAALIYLRQRPEERSPRGH